MQNAIKQEISRESLLTQTPADLVNLVLELDSMYKLLDAKNNQLAEQLRIAMAEKYSSKSERFVDANQLLLFPAQSVSSAEESAGDGAPGTSESNAEKKPISKVKVVGHTRKPKPELSHVNIPAPAPSPELLPCTCCGVDRIATRQILQASRYQYIPASFIIEDLQSQVYECPKCGKSEPLIVKVPEVVENGNAAPGLLAQIVVARDDDHVPFNRQSKIFKRSGVDIPRSTICDYYGQTASILTPLYDYMHTLLELCDIISTDDTPVKVLDRTKIKKIKLGRVWVYIGDKTHPVTLFDSTSGRGRIGPLTFLSKFKGQLQGDCFSGNLAVSAAIGTTLVACLAHARRYFVKAQDNNKQGSDYALSVFQGLYEIERTAQELELNTEDVKRMRQEEAEPILNEFYLWLQKEYLTAQPKSTYGKALFYNINNWKELKQYIQDGNLKIDNNHCEREMKYIAMGRKAWLFFGSDKGGKNHAVILSILATCRRHSIEPVEYLTDVIQRLAEDRNANLEELLPYNWKQKYPIQSQEKPKSEVNSISSCSKAA